MHLPKISNVNNFNSVEAIIQAFSEECRTLCTLFCLINCSHHSWPSLRIRESGFESLPESRRTTHPVVYPLFRPGRCIETWANLVLVNYGEHGFQTCSVFRIRFNETDISTGATRSYSVCSQLYFAVIQYQFYRILWKEDQVTSAGRRKSIIYGLVQANSQSLLLPMENNHALGKITPELFLLHFLEL